MYYLCYHTNQERSEYMQMLEYKPWAKSTTGAFLSESSKNLPILDIQLGGACNLNCVYCDTPKYGYPCLVDLPSVSKLIEDGNIEWIYVCGLGEPTVKDNLAHLKQLLAWCKEKKIGLSMFSNMLDIDRDILDYIDQGILNVLFKLDTFDRVKINYLYGRDVWKTITRNYKLIEEVNHPKSNTTNLAASIVPTSINYDEVTTIIDYCMEKGIFPLIGQLESSGKCSGQLFRKLEVKEEELMKLRIYLEQTYAVHYEIPICPATVSGIHITNTNHIILDERTGLSCPWFWLDEPQIIEIGNIKDMTYKEIVRKILEYRRQKLDSVKTMAEHTKEYPFGGCGGDVKKLLKTYISYQ